ncbi:hypothetical protein GOV13_04980 [Candidatus Pacearchaeota archaeon]|nr:hypothetical protein [Candidatus Pacearchaeota archaeon]
MVVEIFQNIGYFLHLTVTTELLWIVFPLAVATIVMLVYFERYKEERPGWNTYVANSLVLLFVSVILFKYIYSINGAGLNNFVTFLSKFIVSLFILLGGVIILSLNFEHYLPEKIAMYLSSPLTLNMVAYIAILYVYSELDSSGFVILLSLLILFVLLVSVWHILRIPLKKLFVHLKRMKEKEKLDKILGEKVEIRKKKKELKKEERKIKKEKKEVKKVEKKTEEENLKELDKQKKEAVKLKKVVLRPEYPREGRVPKTYPKGHKRNKRAGKK